MLAPACSLQGDELEKFQAATQELASKNIVLAFDRCERTEQQLEVTLQFGSRGDALQSLIECGLATEKQIEPPQDFGDQIDCQPTMAPSLTTMQTLNRAYVIDVLQRQGFRPSSSWPVFLYNNQ